MEPLNEKSQTAQEYGLLPADARQQLKITTRSKSSKGVGLISKVPSTSISYLISKVSLLLLLLLLLLLVERLIPLASKTSHVALVTKVSSTAKVVKIVAIIEVSKAATTKVIVAKVST